jgi:hypothetical protein
MPLPSFKRSYVIAPVLLAAGLAGWLVLGGGKSAADTKSRAAPKAAATTAASSDPNLYPFGRPSGGPAVNVPPPPEEPTLAPTIATKTTTRLYGANPYEKAVSITQHIWPAAVPENAPAENDNDPDRPWGLTLVTPDDVLTAITATPLIHFPDDAPMLFVSKDGIPEVTLNEIKRLGDTGISRFNNVDAFLVGAAANRAVESQLKSLGLKYVEVTASNIPELANKVDQLYGSIENPDTGVPNMGNGAYNVMVGSMDGKDYQYLLPATHWVAHMASGLLWVTKGSVPQPTIDALKRRNGRANIYLFGGPDQISVAVAKQLAQYGTIIRVTNNDIVAFNAPLLLTTSPTELPPAVDGYYRSVAPTYLTTPADGPYNMTYVIGDWAEVSWPLQAHVDYISEMANRRLWNQNTGGRYTDSSQ